MEICEGVFFGTINPLVNTVLFIIWYGKMKLETMSGDIFVLVLRSFSFNLKI